MPSVVGRMFGTMGCCVGGSGVAEGGTSVGATEVFVGGTSLGMNVAVGTRCVGRGVFVSVAVAVPVGVTRVAVGRGVRLAVGVVVSVFSGTMSSDDGVLVSLKEGKINGRK